MKTLIPLLIAVFLYVFPITAHAQFNVGKRIENKTINRGNQRTDQGIEKGLDGVESVFKKKKQIEKG